MTPNQELIAGIAGGIFFLGAFLGKQLAKVLAEKAENIRRDMKIEALEKWREEIDEERTYQNRHRDK